VLLLVDHDAFDLRSIGDQARFVFDTRNAMPDDTAASVVTLGSLVETEIETDDPRRLTDATQLG